MTKKKTTKTKKQPDVEAQIRFSLRNLTENQLDILREVISMDILFALRDTLVGVHYDEILDGKVDHDHLVDNLAQLREDRDRLKLLHRVVVDMWVEKCG